jgi:hypothetical protein
MKGKRKMNKSTDCVDWIHCRSYNKCKRYKELCKGEKNNG